MYGRDKQVSAYYYLMSLFTKHICISIAHTNPYYCMTLCFITYYVIHFIMSTPVVFDMIQDFAMGPYYYVIVYNQYAIFPNNS